MKDKHTVGGKMARNGRKIGNCHYHFTQTIVYLLFLLSKARQAKMEPMEIKIPQPILGILVALTKNEVTKICNEPGLRSLKNSFQFLKVNHTYF